VRPHLTNLVSLPCGREESIRTIGNIEKFLEFEASDMSSGIAFFAASRLSDDCPANWILSFLDRDLLPRFEGVTTGALRNSQIFRHTVHPRFSRER
jgi:hypothetical protein